MLKILIALEILLVGSPTLARASEVELYCNKTGECEHFAWEKINAVCMEGSCICYNNHTFDYTECIPNVIRANNIIGGPCCPCSLPHSECNRWELICYCEDGYLPIERNRRCIREAVPLGEICELDEQCMAANTFSHCHHHSNRCTCNDDFHQHNGTCLARTKSRTECSEFTHDLTCVLSGSNLVCLAEECVCEPGFISLNTTDNCMPERSYKEECNITKQCQGIMGTGASCIEGKCFCDKEYQVVREIYTGKLFCKRLPVIGQYCAKDEHCHSRNATKENQLMECYRTECACRFGIKNKPPCMLSMATSLIPIIGQYCTKDEQCHSTNATKENQLMECYRTECACRFGIKNKPPCMLSMATSLIASKVTLWFMLFLVIFLIFVQRY